MPGRRFKNRLLRQMKDEDLQALDAYLEPVTMEPRDVLVRGNAPIKHVYFPESGMISVHARKGEGGRGATIEVGMIGFEGMSDMVSGAATPLQAAVNVGGAAHRIEHAVIAQRARESLALSDLVLRFHQYKIIQMGFISLSHGSFTVPQRLARWLLMASDRVGADVPLAHDHLASSLGVRRAGISEGLKKLEERGDIGLRRGHIIVLDRKGLIEAAAGGYGLAEAEYERLLGEPSDKQK